MQRRISNESRIRRSVLSLALASAVGLSLGLPTQAAHAQATDWPGNKTIRVVSVFPPGGSVDQVARLLAEQLGKTTGGQFIVENKGGASGSIGTAQVAKAAADGTTIGVVFDTHAVNPSLIPNLPFDTLKDLSPISLVGRGGMAVVTHPSTPFKSFSELISAAKAKPDSIFYGSIGAGSLGHLAMVQVANNLGLQWTHVPYKGGGPLKTEISGGQIPVAIGSVFLMNPLVQAGQVRPLAVTSAKQDPQMPGVKTMIEQGVPGFEAYSWWGVFGPAGMSPDLVKKIHGEIAKVLADPAVKAKLEAQGMEVLSGGPKDLDSFNRNEIKRWGEVVRKNNITSGS